MKSAEQYSGLRWGNIAFYNEWHVSKCVSRESDSQERAIHFAPLTRAIMFSGGGGAKTFWVMRDSMH